MHTRCVPVILQYEQATCTFLYEGVYKFLNIKFGGTLEIKDHPHRLSFVQGVESDGNCSNCLDQWKPRPFFLYERRLEQWEFDQELMYKMIFKCMECEFALHYKCASKFAC
ncbi:hypothetical protein Hdeb2414_s0001g00013461 [Helianthus debilis subsp. tardiflorus]